MNPLPHTNPSHFRSPSGQVATTYQTLDIIYRALCSQPHTAYELQRIVKDATGRLYSESNITARVRELRQERRGKHDVRSRSIRLNSDRVRYEYFLPQAILVDAPKCAA